jgi:hypothetical protein
MNLSVIIFATSVHRSTASGQKISTPTCIVARALKTNPLCLVGWRGEKVGKNQNVRTEQ